ncbi:MAG: ABC transporter ATP-binding protein [Lachnospiraceae bacterium]|nr:ABC transporter ATP-binding protein [Lachnospiraceae bacterium]
MWKLLKYMKDYKRESVCAPLFKLLEALFELFVPLVMARIIDVGIKNQDTGYILRMCLLMAALGLIGLVCSITAQYFSAKAAVGFASRLRHELFSHIQGLSFSEMDTIGASTLITRMTSDINQVQSGVNLFLRLFMRSPFIVFGAMVMAFTIDAKAALIFVVVIPVLCVIVFGIMLVSIPIYRRVQERLDRVVGVTRENLQGVRVIRAFCREPEEIEAFESGNAALVRIQLLSGKISALMNPLTYVVINGALLVLLYVGAGRVDAGILMQGSVVALVNYMSQILVELVKLANLIITVTKAIACGNRIQFVMETQSSMQDGNGALGGAAVQDEGGSSEEEAVRKENGVLGGTAVQDGSGVLEKDLDAVTFENVQFRYAGAGADSLSNISFSVKRGETVGIIGGTGSGKSSLVGLIPRFYDVREGCVKVNGTDVRDYPLEKIRGLVGIVMQKAVLFQGTIRENLLWGNENATEDDLKEALRIAQAEDVVFGAKGGLDTEVEQEGRNFSGGQKQRLTIARALVRKPEILILDDSASALDFATDAKLREAIANLPGDMTVFIVSQRTSSIQHADKIIVLDDGEMVGIGTHEELLKSCDVYQETYYSQFPKEEVQS